MIDLPVATDDPPGLHAEPEAGDAATESVAVRAPIPGRHLVVLAIVVALGRWWFSAERRVFHLAPDEPGQLAMARWIAGGERWNLFDHSTWRPGFAVLMAPAYWFTDRAETVYRVGIALAAVLAGLAAVLTAALARRLTTLSPIPCVLVAGAIALTPASLSASAHVWGESLLTLAFLATVLALLAYFDAPTVAGGTVAVVVAVLGFTAHSRMLPVVAVVVALAVGAMLWRRRWWEASVLVAASSVAFGAASAFMRRVFDAVYDDPGQNNTAAETLDRLGEPLLVLEALAGQFWYQLVATVGVAGIGTAVLLRRALTRRRPSEGAAGRDARLVLLLVGSLVATSAIFMSDRTRPDQVIYGRYNDAVVWPVLVVGAGWLLRLDRLPRHRLVAGVGGVLALLAATTAIVEIRHADLFDGGVGVRSMVPGLVAYMADGGAFAVVRWAIVAGALLVVAVVVARASGRPAAVLAAGAALLLSLGAERAHDGLNLRLNGWARAGAVTAIEDGILPDGATVGVRFVRDGDDPAISWEAQRQRAQLYQYYLGSDHAFVLDRGTDDDVGPFVFAPVDDPDLEAVDAEVLWVEPSARMALWREPTGG